MFSRCKPVLHKLKIPAVYSDLRDSYFCVRIHPLLCFRVCSNAGLPGVLPHISACQVRRNQGATDRGLALTKAQGNTHQWHWAFSDSFLKRSASHWARRNLKCFPYHIGTCTSKSHEFWIELQTGYRTCVFPIQHSHLHPTFPIPNMNFPIFRTCRQEWKTRYTRYAGETGRENEVHNLFWQRTVGTSMPRLHSLTFKIPEVSLRHLQNITRVYTPVSKQQVYIFALRRLNYATQCNAILAKRLTTTVTQ